MHTAGGSICLQLVCLPIERDTGGAGEETAKERGRNREEEMAVELRGGREQESRSAG